MGAEEPLTKQEIRLSHFLSRVLRHEPARAFITVDDRGWADVDSLLDGCRKAGHPMTRETLDRIVALNSKRRYAYSRDGKRIRASQGHSFPVNLELEPLEPPEILWHGTSTAALESIRREGIRKMGRQYVHLSTDPETAARVGQRHGTPAVLCLEAGRMSREGIDFFCSENGVWMCGEVPPRYIRNFK